MGDFLPDVRRSGRVFADRACRVLVRGATTGLSGNRMIAVRE
jgi:hypothetical protein